MYTEIVSIDDDFLEENIIDRQEYDYEYDNVYFAYYAGYSEVTMQAVCNHICLPNEDYVIDLYEKALSVHSPLFLMAEGGTGKTTLLCQTALYAKQQGILTFFLDTTNNVDLDYFVNYMDEVVFANTNKSKKVLFCIDNFRGFFLNSFVY